VPWKAQDDRQRATRTWTWSTSDTCRAVSSEHGATGGGVTNAGFAAFAVLTDAEPLGDAVKAQQAA
jgi:hypothetical protein